MVTWNPLTWVNLAEKSDPSGPLFGRLNRKESDARRVRRMEMINQSISELLALFPDGDHRGYAELKSQYTGSLNIGPAEAKQRLATIDLECQNIQDERQQLNMFFAIIAGLGDEVFLNEMENTMARLRAIG